MTKWLILLKAIVSLGILSYTPCIALAATVQNNSYEGFKVGSWNEETSVWYTDGKKEARRMKTFIVARNSDGSTSMQSYDWSESENKFIKNDYGSASMPSVVVTREGWHDPGQGEKIIYDKVGLLVTKDSTGWKESNLPSEKLQIDGKSYETDVRSWVLQTNDSHSTLKLWFSDKISIPIRHVRLGRHVLDLCLGPRLVKFTWSHISKGNQLSATGHIEDLDAKVKVGQKEYRTVIWHNEFDNKITRSWVYDNIPGRQLKSETRDKATGKFTHTTDTHAFKIASDPIPPKNTQLLEGLWKGCAVGSWVEYTLTKTEKDKKVWSYRDTFVGLSDAGKLIINRKYIKGKALNKEGNWILNTPRTIRQQNAKLVTTKKGQLKIDNQTLNVQQKNYQCTDKWGRKWTARIITCDDKELVRRPLSSWFASAKLESNIISTAIDVRGRKLLREIQSFNDIIKVGERQVTCFKEKEALISPSTVRQTNYWHSPSVPGDLVLMKETSKSPEGETSEEIRVTDFKKLKIAKDER